MSHKKAWKEFSYIKNDHERDSESEISESRSSQSYHFNKVKFNKSRDNIQTSTKKFGLANIIKIKDNSRENSLINDFILKKGETSFVQKMERPSLPSKFKTSKNRKIETKMQKFLYDVKKIHESFKNFAENILSSFEKIKDELETNLLKVIDQLLKSGNSIKHQEKIHELIHQSFLDMKRNISILPCSLTQFNSKDNLSSPRNLIDNEIPSSPLLKPYEAPTLSKSRPKIHSIFSPKEATGEYNFELPISSSQKVRQKPETERKTHTRFGSFNNDVIVKEFREVTLPSKREKEKLKEEYSNLEKPDGIDNIICQMRSILNQ